MTPQIAKGKWMMAASLAVAGLVLPAGAQTTGQQWQNNQGQPEYGQGQQQAYQGQQQPQSYQDYQGQQQPQYYQGRQQPQYYQGQPGYWPQNGYQGQPDGRQGFEFIGPRNQGRPRYDGQFSNPQSSNGWQYSQPGQFGYARQGGWGSPQGQFQGQQGNWGYPQQFQGQQQFGQRGWGSNQPTIKWSEQSAGQPSSQWGQGMQQGRTVIMTTGQVQSTRKFHLQGEKKAHEFAILQTQSGQNVVVDLGPKSNLSQISLQPGHDLAVIGRMERVDGQPVLEATTVSDITQVPQEQENEQAQQAGMQLQGQKRTQFQDWISQQEQQGQDQGQPQSGNQTQDQGQDQGQAQPQSQEEQDQGQSEEQSGQTQSQQGQGSSSSSSDNSSGQSSQSSSQNSSGDSQSGDSGSIGQ